MNLFKIRFKLIKLLEARKVYHTALLHLQSRKPLRNFLWHRPVILLSRVLYRQLFLRYVKWSVNSAGMAQKSPA